MECLLNVELDEFGEALVLLPETSVLLVALPERTFEILDSLVLLLAFFLMDMAMNVPPTIPYPSSDR